MKEEFSIYSSQKKVACHTLQSYMGKYQGQSEAEGVHEKEWSRAFIVVSAERNGWNSIGKFVQFEIE